MFFIVFQLGPLKKVSFFLLGSLCPTFFMFSFAYYAEKDYETVLYVALFKG